MNDLLPVPRTLFYYIKAIQFHWREVIIMIMTGDVLSQNI